MLRHEFGSFDGRVWLNCAHQGPLPLRAVSAAQRAIEQKVSPHLMEEEAFWKVPKGLKALIGRIIGAPEDEVILGNSTTYGLHLLARGLPLESADEVLLTEGEFPATVFP